ncbi:hypothetical protein J4479_01795 [Candidatus Woesearchaeota archaeon]|nr:hypothetical protein [Candidatus Woesearchaeota archaeon]
MKWYQQKWWKKLFKETPRKKLDSEQELQAMIDFLGDIKADVKTLYRDLKTLLELEQERQVAASGIVHININTQAKLLDKIIEQYEFMESDVAINGLRLKHLAEKLLEEAQQQGMGDLAEEKQKKWRLD